MGKFKKTDDKAKENREVSLTVLYTLTASVLLIMALVIKLALNAFFPPPTQLTGISQLEEIIALKFPNSAVIIDSEYHRSWSPMVIGKLSISKADWNGFKSQKKFVNQWSNECDFNENDVADMKERGWKVSQIKKPACVNAVSTPGRVDGLWMTADLSKKAEVLLYIYYQN